jgi:hypothetical protein
LLWQWGDYYGYGVVFLGQLRFPNHLDYENEVVYPLEDLNYPSYLDCENERVYFLSLPSSPNLQMTIWGNLLDGG